MLWNRCNGLSLCFPGGALHALVSVSLTAGNDQIRHDMGTTKSYENARLSVYIHTHTHTPHCVLEGCAQQHYLPWARVDPRARGALHVTQHSEIFKHHIQTKKQPCQTALDDTKYGRAVDGVRAEQVTSFFSFLPQIKLSGKKIVRVQSSEFSRQFFKLARD